MVPYHNLHFYPRRRGLPVVRGDFFILVDSESASFLHPFQWYNKNMQYGDSAARRGAPQNMETYVPFLGAVYGT